MFQRGSNHQPEHFAMEKHKISFGKFNEGNGELFVLQSPGGVFGVGKTMEDVDPDAYPWKIATERL